VAPENGNTMLEILRKKFQQAGDNRSPRQRRRGAQKIWAGGTKKKSGRMMRSPESRAAKKARRKASRVRHTH